MSSRTYEYLSVGGYFIPLKGDDYSGFARCHVPQYGFGMIKMNVWPSSQNFCGRHAFLTVYSDWYSSCPHGRHLVSSLSVQNADRYVPVYKRKTPLICLVGVHIVAELFRCSVEPPGCFYEAETKLRFSSWWRGLWLRGCSSFTYTLPLQNSNHFKALFKSAQALLYALFGIMFYTKWRVLEDYLPGAHLLQHCLASPTYCVWGSHVGLACFLCNNNNKNSMSKWGLKTFNGIRCKLSRIWFHVGLWVKFFKKWMSSYRGKYNTIWNLHLWMTPASKSLFTAHTC